MENAVFAFTRVTIHDSYNQVALKVLLKGKQKKENNKRCRSRVMEPSRKARTPQRAHRVPSL